MRHPHAVLLILFQVEFAFKTAFRDWLCIDHKKGYKGQNLSSIGKAFCNASVIWQKDFKTGHGGYLNR
jgi:hypothetical protein